MGEPTSLLCSSLELQKAIIYTLCLTLSHVGHLYVVFAPQCAPYTNQNWVSDRGRGYSFQELSPEDKQSQREEAFARATVPSPEPNAFASLCVLFFFAGAVRARSSDGHQSIGLDCPFPRMRIK